MYEFTKRAQVALDYTKNFAVSLNSGYIGTEHMLYGLIKEGKGLASKILTAQEITANQVEESVIKLYGSPNKSNKTTEPMLTPRAHRVLEESVKEAKKLNCKYVGTEHILVALLKETDSMAVRVLIDLSVDPNRIFIDIFKLTAESDNINNSAIFKNISTPNLDMYAKDLTRFG